MKRRYFQRAIAAGLLLACAAAQGGEETIILQDAPGRDVTATRCAICHSLDYIEMNAAVRDRGGWQQTVRKMIDRFGAPVTDAEAQEIIDYLATHYSSSPGA